MRVWKAKRDPRQSEMCPLVLENKKKKNLYISKGYRNEMITPLNVIHKKKTEKQLEKILEHYQKC